MKYRIEELLERARKNLSKKEYIALLDRIYEDESIIYDFVIDGIDAYMGDKEVIRNFKNVLGETISAMNDINEFAREFEKNDIFVFDANNPKTVLRNASSLNRSAARFHLERIENENKKDAGFFRK